MSHLYFFIFTVFVIYTNWIHKCATNDWLWCNCGSFKLGEVYTVRRPGPSKERSTLLAREKEGKRKWERESKYWKYWITLAFVDSISLFVCLFCFLSVSISFWLTGRPIARKSGYKGTGAQRPILFKVSSGSFTFSM